MEKKKVKKISNDIEALKSQVENNIDEAINKDLEPGEFEEYETKQEHRKSRLWIMLLYPDNPDHQKIIEDLPKRFSNAIWSCHDSDLNEDGKPLKEHIHVVLYFSNEVYKSRITNPFAWYFDINRFVKIAKDVKKRTRYLLHLDDPDKYQYPMDYLEGNVEAYIKYFDKEKKEASDVTRILMLIKYHLPYSLLEFVQMMADEGLYSTYRRNSSTFNSLYFAQRERLYGSKD